MPGAWRYTLEASHIVHVKDLPLANRCRRNSYDGEMEFWVVLKETGKRTETSSYEHEHSKRMKACYNVYSQMFRF